MTLLSDFGLQALTDSYYLLRRSFNPLFWWGAEKIIFHENFIAPHIYLGFSLKS